MLRSFIPLTLLMFCFIACSQRNAGSLPGYDLSSPQIIKLPPELNEISGITFSNGEPDTLYAEQDEEGKLFYFTLSNIQVQSWQFAKKGDYEDVSIANNKVFILRSDGAISGFALNNVSAGVPGNIHEFPFLVPKGEYESLYADPAENKLYVLCKACNTDKGGEKVSGYSLKWNSNMELTKDGEFAVNTAEIATVLGKKKNNFRPSALAKNTRSNEWYILSSVNKALVVTDLQWKVKQAVMLGGSNFPQPEGMAFDKHGNLYISNERGNSAQANILKFTYNESKK